MGSDSNRMRTRIGLTTLLAGLSLAGCTTTPFREAAAKPRERQGDEVFADRFLAHWNHNAEAIQSVVCEKVDVEGRSEGQPYTLDARIAFQSPNNFRLMGYFLGKSEADLGSNGQEIWFWMARAQPPAVYFCKRDDLARVSLPMPFHPDDLLEVLGAVRLDPDKYRFESGWENCVTMVSPQTAPSGDPVVKRLVIDRASGRASAFQVWDVYHGKQRLLAEARILDYYDDPTGAFVPKKVKLKLPDANTDLTLTMKASAIRLNDVDRQWASTLFRRGNYVNAQVVDLGEEFRKRQAALERPRFAEATPVRLESSQVVVETPRAVARPTPADSAGAAPIPPTRPAELYEGIQPGGYRGVQPAARGASFSGGIERTGASERRRN